MIISDESPKYCPDKCIGCEHARPEGHTTHFYVCTRYLEPEKLWRSGVCPSATHMKTKQNPEQKKRAGQQHQKRQKGLSKKQEESYRRLG